MNALKIVLLIIALVLLIVSVATPMWLEGEKSVMNPTPAVGASASTKTDVIKPKITYGLWEACIVGNDNLCSSNTILTGNKDVDATVNSVRTLGLLSIVLVAFAILCCFMCKNKAPVMILICIALLSCISTIGVTAGKLAPLVKNQVRKDMNIMLGTDISLKEGYSFWLQVAAACVLLLVFVMKLIVKGKKM